ncbi:thioredoxin family protein [Hanstruepera neustonica]|uniref:Thioredoxin family protein n=1 Tax=Hanstruepera neustonica TaxID=1445657 RepID=A0A2K1E472_9FLAO|nr:thioredoxin family protein [Hanstruepera neustonica]PNQ75063.1 thioredoxin family protein [Hanstruepera neustonica]
MEITHDKDIQTIIDNSLKTAINYKDYKELVKNMVDNKLTTGNDKSEAMVNYTMLNDRRMKRWDKTVKVSEESKKRLEGFDKQVTWLVITESWCGDAAHVIPVLNKIAELNQNIDLKLVMRDDNYDLMNQFLTNGGRAIPKLIMLDNKTKDVLGTYGPRPSQATKLVNDFKKVHGKLTPEFKEDLQRWYNANKGQTAIEDLLQLLGV